jgi:hypothetical protein
MKLEFISYDGAYPNLCRGNLVVKIGKRTVKFGDGGYPPFWMSGGKMSFTNEGACAVKADWELINYFISDPYPKYIKKELHNLLALFNDNVRKGCCGGCI